MKKQFLSDSGLTELIGYIKTYITSKITWGNVTGKPTTFPPENHSHDDRYYTESEVENKLSAKSNNGHTHDDRYYTESEMNSKLSGKSDTNHSHNLSTMINGLDSGTATPTDSDYYISQWADGGTSNTSAVRRSHSALWSYIKSKADSIYQAKGNYASSNHNHTISNITNIGSASVNYANSAGSASSATTAGTCTGNSATATSVLDYGNTSAKINIGYNGSGISGDEIKYLAGYTTGTNGATANIKDVSKDALKSWLGLGSLAYSSATIPTIPSSLPANGGNASTVNGHTVNANVPAGAKFTDTDTWRGIQDNLTSTSTSDSLSANQGKVLKGLIDGKSNSGHTHSTATTNASGFMSSTDKIKLNTLASEMDAYFTQEEINTIFA